MTYLLLLFVIFSLILKNCTNKTLSTSFFDTSNPSTLKNNAPWSSGERHGLTIMVLECWFEYRHHLKTRWKDETLDGRKSNKKYRQPSVAKKYLKKVCFTTQRHKYYLFRDCDHN
jgi:hypothetical protein